MVVCICCHCCHLHKNCQFWRSGPEYQLWYFQNVDKLDFFLLRFAKPTPQALQMMRFCLWHAYQPHPKRITYSQAMQNTWCKVSISSSSDTGVLYRTLQCRLRPKWPSITQRQKNKERALSQLGSYLSAKDRGQEVAGSKAVRHQSETNTERENRW